MENTTLPPLRVTPAFRRSAERALASGESLSSFMLESIVLNIQRRQVEREFIARGLASEKRAQRTGKYVSAEKVLGKLEQRLARAKRRKR